MHHMLVHSMLFGSKTCYMALHMWVAYALLKLWYECDSKGFLHCNQCTEHTRQTTDCDWHINLSMTLQSGVCEGTGNNMQQHTTLQMAYSLHDMLGALTP